MNKIEEYRDCKCGGLAFWSTHCGCFVCESCENHISSGQQKFVRCFCGWNLQPGEILEDDSED